MDNETKELKERKNQLEIELKEIREKIKKTKMKNNQNSVNRLIRVNNKFDEAIDNINEKREISGFDKLSKPKTTELVVRHKNWNQIKNDIIHFNIELEENRGIINVQ